MEDNKAIVGDSQAISAHTGGSGLRNLITEGNAAYPLATGSSSVRTFIASLSLRLRRRLTNIVCTSDGNLPIDHRRAFLPAVLATSGVIE